ncbi:maleylpyruvate isomerase family mycothiol-dependent enzyme [Parasphingorhabdus pacifica]
MASDFHHRAWNEQAAAFRAAAVQAGENAEVSTCAGWNVGKLVRHLGRVYAMADLALQLGPEDAAPRPPSPPEEFDEALSWFDARHKALRDQLSTMDSAKPVWSFFPGGTPGSWLRRMTHETAIHRLDAEHARTGLAAESVHQLIFDPELAADGVDEMLSVLAGARDWSGDQSAGRVLYHAADAGRTWLVQLSPGLAPEIGPPQDAALGQPEVDATVAGTADAVYRHVWGRPSHAVVTGEASLAGAIAGR